MSEKTSNRKLIPSVSRTSSLLVSRDTLEHFTITESYVFSFISYYIARHGKSTHSRKTVANHVRCNHRTVRRAIDKLCAKGWLIVEENYHAPSGLSFVWGEKVPENVRFQYLSLHWKGKAPKPSDVLLRVRLEHIPKKVNGSASQKVRKLAYLKSLIAYRCASRAINSKKKFARYVLPHRSALAELISVCEKTIITYLKDLIEAKDIHTPEGITGHLVIDAAVGQMLDEVQTIKDRLSAHINRNSTPF